MFTGLVKEVGKVKNITVNTEGKLFEYESAELIEDMEIDDSVSINGACQTVIRKSEKSFFAQAVGTTLEKTNLNDLKAGDPVNMELALRLADRLGGHLVQGHINGTGKIKKIMNQGKNYLLTVGFPAELSKYFIEEGSVCLEGISLTISHLGQNELTVSIIPHTWDQTTLKWAKVGKKVNIEVDLVAKYIERMLLMGRTNQCDNEYINWIKSKGFN
jgi:riboflavin synthase